MSAPEITDEHAGKLAALVRQSEPANAWAGEKLVAAGRDLQGNRVASPSCTPKAEERGAKAAPVTTHSAKDDVTRPFKGARCFPKILPPPEYDSMQSYVDCGWTLIPLHKPGEHVAVLNETTKQYDWKDATKAPRDSAWTTKEYNGVAVLADCRAAGLNVGVRPNIGQGIIDVDTHGADGLASFKQFCADTGCDSTKYSRVDTPTGGFHLYMTGVPADANIPVKSVKYPGLEFRFGPKFQVAAAGDTHPNGGRYRQNLGHPALKDTGAISTKMVEVVARKPKAEKPKDANATPLVTTDQLATMLPALSVEQFDTGQKWREIVYACHAATKGDKAALKRIQDWSAGDAERWPNGRADAADVWERADADRPDGITAATLFKALKDAGRSDLIPVDPDLEGMNRRHAVMPIGNKTCVVTFEDDGVSIKRAQSFENFAQLENRYRHEYVNAGGERKSVPRGTWWLNQPKRRQHDGGRRFMPDRDERVVGDTLNTWTGFAVVPRKPDGKSGAAGSRLFLNHGCKVICSGNEEHFDYEIKRRAWIGQRRLRSEIAGVYRSDAEGSGKGIWLRGNGHLYGRHHMQVNSAEHVAGKHNEHLETLVSLTADEALFASDPRHRNALYGLITEPDLTIEPKFIGAYSAPNRLNIDISSNARHVVPASNTARRMFVPTVSEDRVGDLEYFRRIDAELREGGYEALLYHLLHEVDVRDFDPRRVPKTAGLAEQAAYSRKGVDRLVEEWINDGCLPFCHPSKPHIIITSGEEDGRGFDHFIRNKAPDDLRRLGPLQVKNELRRAWGSAHWSSRVKYQQCAGIVMPALSELRAKFEAKHGPQDWRCDATEWGGSDDAIPF